MVDILKFIDRFSIVNIDLTGGAPELNKNFKFFIKELKNRNCHIIDRCNLTIILEKSMSGLADFLKQNEVEIIASLPCYIQENVDKQRGKDVFVKSIKALKLLNKIGYGLSPSLKLNLVYNPQGPSLPPDQLKLSRDYKEFLKDKFDIRFHNLFTITNMPIARFGSTLISKNKFSCVVGFSGKIINQEDLKQRMRTSTNILLIHGDSDQVVSPNYILEAKDFFIRSNIEIETHLIKNCDHHIPIEASSIALNYILKKIK